MSVQLPHPSPRPPCCPLPRCSITGRVIAAHPPRHRGVSRGPVAHVLARRHAPVRHDGDGVPHHGRADGAWHRDHRVASPRTAGADVEGRGAAICGTRPPPNSINGGGRFRSERFQETMIAFNQWPGRCTTSCCMPSTTRFITAARATRICARSASRRRRFTSGSNGRDDATAVGRRRTTDHAS